ncbi:CBS domain-containing protein [Methanimicrococcus blatticola]|uniref:CBS domain protein n=1 Tax=Methanimicrococcus blatticola TaxID=91560 RepID=A0A484F7R0_9EURY|nr:CBS domain-containing protein [Methanimicrococcus blatticola]MBZ3936170.1 CBS domain-containing protein [Methanimicrococcus blatticola]MCC2508413.1 CBS domain-containing protein [Methanimicrococcus blatticola]TDQ70134.1 CBS domain protein [Methanimicrococcus blatticola]
MQVKDIMVAPPTIDKSAKISNALGIMEKKNTRRLLVMHNGEVTGILTMRGLAKELGTKKRTKPASSLPVVTAVTDNYTFVKPATKFAVAAKILKEKGGVLLVSENEKDVLGWITPNELIGAFDFGGQANDIMFGKTIITINSSERLVHARYLMLENNIGRIPVMEDGKLVGIISERDVAVAFQEFKDHVPDNHQEAQIKTLLVADVMTRNPLTAKPTTPAEKIVNCIVHKNIGIVPIVDDSEKLVGIITRRSLLLAIPTLD